MINLIILVVYVMFIGLVLVVSYNGCLNEWICYVEIYRCY